VLLWLVTLILYFNSYYMMPESLTRQFSHTYFADRVSTPPLSLSPSDWFRSLGWGVSHMGFPSALGSILHIHQVDPQVLHVVLHDVDPPFSLSVPTPLSTYVCLQDSFDTILFSALCMPKPYQPGLLYFVRDVSTSPFPKKKNWRGSNFRFSDFVPILGLFLSFWIFRAYSLT